MWRTFTFGIRHQFTQPPLAQQHNGLLHARVDPAGLATGSFHHATAKMAMGADATAQLRQVHYL